MIARPPRPEALPALQNVSRETIERLEVYAELLIKWQKAINLIGPATAAVLWSRHIADSAQIVAMAPETARIWVDLGSGAGLPGLVAAILLTGRANAQVHLFESDQRKAAFLREAVRVTGAPATVHDARVESTAPFAADVVTARAFAPLDRLLEYAAPFWGEHTLGLFHKGRNVRDELDAAGKRWRFTYHLAASQTDSSGSILTLRSLSRV